MISLATTVDDYIDAAPPERADALRMLRRHIVENLSSGFSETMSYGMPTYVVPLSLYPQGYHCKKDQALPYMSFASQKNYIAVYHMGLYGDEPLSLWFADSWKKHSTKKLDMGKSCIRIKNSSDLPYELFGELAKAYSVEKWIAHYEQRYVR